MTNSTKPKTKTKKRASKYSAEQKQAYADQKRAEQMQMLTEAVDALTSEEGWLNYLKVASAFHKYSFNNRILIAMQRPNATQVAGAKTWLNEFERTIIKGERAIKILAPMISYEKDTDGSFLLVDGKKVIKFVWFKAVPVFDVSQTEGKDMPEPPQPEPLTGESHEEYLYRAEDWFTANGFTVDYDKLMAKGRTAKRGALDMEGKAVYVNGAQSLNARVRTLIHEMAHAIGGIDYSAYSRRQAEVIVESAAFIATGLVGLDTSGMSVPYIATWGKDAEDPKQALKIMKDFTTTIDKVAEAIVEAIS